MKEFTLRIVFEKVKFNMNEDKIFEAFGGTLDLYDEIVCEENIETVGNSFFDRMYFGTCILILAPNPADEISVAGNMILNFSSAKAEIFVVSFKPQNILAKEFSASLKILGVSDKNIIYLDRKNFKRDLKKLIVDLRANIIFCPDYDSDEDQKIFSSTFEEVMGEILTENLEYYPEVYKKFAESTASKSAPDFYAPNLLSVRHPYDCEIIDRANYLWNNRVRFPVHENCRRTLLKNNPLADAIFSYKSKRIEWDALRILNSDEVFFERRTDSQSFSAQVKATSGNASTTRDFKIVGDVWTPHKNDAEKILSFEWNESVQVKQIVIHGNINDESTAKLSLNFELDNMRAKVDESGISFDNFYKVNAVLPKHGNPLVLDVEKIFVRRADITVVEGGEDFGIAEVEFFSNTDPLRRIEPFVKLTTGKDFFYRYDIPYEVEKIPLSLYRFHVDEPVKISVTVKDENILEEILTDNDELILNLNDADEIVLTAEVVGNPNIYDRAILRRVSDLAQIQLKVWQWLDKMRVHKIRNI